MFTSSEVSEFEREFAAFVGAKHVVMVSSCTMAILAALDACDVPAGGHVAVPAYTYIGTCMPVLAKECIPVLVDIDRSSQSMDPEGLRRLAATVKLDAVVCALLFGNTCDYEKFARICDDIDLRIVFDCAQFLGNRAVTSRLAEIGPCCYSFGDSKVLRVGEGGAVATNSELIAERVRMFRHAGEIWLKRGGSRVNDAKITIHDAVHGLGSVRTGLNLRPTAMAAAIGRSQLMSLPAVLRRITNNAAVVADRLSQLGEMVLTSRTEPNVWWTYPFEITDMELERDVVLAALVAEGIPAGVHFPRLIASHPALATRVSHDAPKDFSNATSFSERHLVLPIYPALSEEAAARLADVVVDVLSSPDLRGSRAKSSAALYIRSQGISELMSGLFMVAE